MMKKLISLTQAVLLVTAVMPGPAAGYSGQEIPEERYQSAPRESHQPLKRNTLERTEFNDFNYSEGSWREAAAETAKFIDIQFQRNKHSETALDNYAKPALQTAVPHVVTKTNGSSKQSNELTSLDINTVKNVSIVSVTPEGETNTAKEISITFSQDMVDPTLKFDTDSELTKASDSGLSISPPTQGTWRWFSSRVLVFKPTANRFARSTEFTISIAKSFQSERRLNLVEGKKWKFSTQRAVLNPTSGGFDNRGLCVLVTYGQPIKIASALSKIHMTFGDQEIPLRNATKAESTALVENFVKTEGCYCFVPTKQLPYDQEGKVSIEAGIEAVEGPLLSSGSYVTTIHSDNNKIVCSSPGLVTTEAGQPWHITFSGPMNLTNLNVLDLKQMTKAMFTVDPPLPNLKITASSQEIFIRGDAVPNKEYVLHISSELPGYGVKLGKEVSIKLISHSKIQAEQAAVLTPDSRAFLVTPEGSTKLTIFSKNTATVLASIYAADKICGKDKFLEQTDFANASTTLPDLQKKLSCSPYDTDTNISILDLSALQKTKKNQYVVVLSIPAGPVSNFAETPLREPQAKQVSDKKKSLVKSKKQNILATKFEPICDYSNVVWLQFTPMNVICLSSSNSTRIVCTSLSSGKPVDAQSAKALPDKPLEKIGLGQFALATGMHVPELNGVSVNFKNNITMLPNTLPMHTNIHRTSIYSFSCVGDFAHAKASEPFRFAGFVSSRTVSGELRAAPDGELNYKAEDSSGVVFNSGTTQVKNGVFKSDIAIPFTAKTGVGKISYEYKNESQNSAFTSELRIEPGSKASNQPVELITNAVNSSVGLTTDGTIVAVAKFQNQAGQRPNVPIGWDWSARPAKFAPQGWNDFKFGSTRSAEVSLIDENWQEGKPSTETKDFATFKYANTSKVPLVLTLQASRMLPDQVLQAGHRTFLIQPADLLVGVKQVSINKSGKTSIAVNSIVTDSLGNIKKNKTIEIRVLKDIKAKELFDNVELSRISLQSGEQPDQQLIEVPGDTDLMLVATVKDDLNRSSRTIVDISPTVGPTTPANAEPLAILTDKTDYTPGETCRLRFVQPFEACRGFGAVALDRDITNFEINSRTSNTDIEYVIPNSANGIYAGLIKLFEVNSLEKKCREAEGMFHIVVKPKTKQLRVKLECSPDLNTDSEKQLTLRVTDERNAPVPNANVFVMAYRHDQEDADVQDTNFSDQLLNPTRTHLLANSISRAPGLNDSQNGRKPISEFPVAQQYDDDSDRAIIKLPKPLPNNLAQPLQILKTDSAGRAQLSLNLPPSQSDIRICVQCMTAEGDGIQATSLLIPREERLAFDVFAKTNTDKANETNATSMPALAKTLKDEIQLFASKIAKVSEDWTNLSSPAEPGKFAPVSIVLSNSLLTPLAVSAECLINKDPQTSDLRAARVLTSLSLMPFLQDPKIKQRYVDAVINDCAELQNLMGSGNFSQVNWIPLRRIDGNAREIESPWTKAMLVHSWLLANKSGYGWTSSPFFSLDDCIRPLYDMNDSAKLAENASASGYGAYVASLVFHSFPTSFFGSVNWRVEPYLKKISELPPEATAWFMLCKDDLKLPSDSDQSLQSEFKRNIDAEIAESTHPRFQGKSKLRRLAAMLLATIQLKYNDSVIEKLKTLIGRELTSPSVQNNERDWTIAALALSAYYEKKGTIIPPQSATIDFDTIGKQEILFDKNKPSIAVVDLGSNGSQLRLSGSKDITYGAVFRKLEDNSIANNHGIAIRRTFRATDADSKTVFSDSTGAWHCKKGSMVMELIEFIPEKTLEHAVLREPRSYAIGAKIEALPEHFIYAPRHKVDYSRKWIQATSGNDSELVAYGSDLPPLVYNFEYKLKFLTPGTYRLPGVIVRSAYDSRCYGTSEPQTLIVSP
jgi:hypothetical protein